MMELFFFWLFVIVHLTHALRVLVHAEELERAKFAQQPRNQPFNAATRFLFAGALFLPGVVWADLAWLWATLAAFTLLAGGFALILASATPTETPETRPPVSEALIRERARERRIGVILKVALLALWVYAWRMHWWPG